ncbi:MAG: oxygen-insensitive NAD(P)H nitroreductase [Clostridia bacterium]|nr:oxygen-insensitive NAD(P)H nitroreductase [Clostridia bacterium]
MELIQLLNARYATKSFDASKKISEENLKKIEQLLQLSPSSTNIQPWHFILATSEEGKSRITKAMKGFYSFNEKKVLNASAVVVFATKVDIADEHLARISEQEDQDQRYATEQIKQDNYAGRKRFVDIHKYDRKDLHHWLEKQVYLNVGNFLLGLAHLGIDAVPMEGFDAKALDKEFALHEKGYTASVVVALGYRSESDYNSKLPKSRLAIESIIEKI